MRTRTCPACGMKYEYFTGLSADAQLAMHISLRHTYDEIQAAYEEVEARQL